jgi:hypothetical protein
MNINDYTVIARGIAASNSQRLTAAQRIERYVLVDNLARYLAAEDSNFDRTWFVRACGCDCS